MNISKFCTPIGRMQDWTFEDCNIRDLSGYGDLESLKLISCPRIDDVSPLTGGAVDVVWITSNSLLEDVSGLAGTRKLNLSYCNNIKDVSMLGNVDSLCLKGCSGVMNVDNLRNISINCIPSHLKTFSSMSCDCYWRSTYKDYWW